MEYTEDFFFFTQFCYSTIVFLYFQDNFPIYYGQEYNCNLDLKQALNPTSNLAFFFFFYHKTLLSHRFCLCFPVRFFYPFMCIIWSIGWDRKAHFQSICCGIMWNNAVEAWNNSTYLCRTGWFCTFRTPNVQG